MLTYHYYAIAQDGFGRTTHFDGIVTRESPSFDADDYAELKADIAGYEGNARHSQVDPGDIILCSLSLLDDSSKR